MDRIITGRLEKFFEEVVLLDQPFIRDSDLKISDVVKQTSGTVGCNVDIKQVIRFRVGEQA
jgi:elongation factor Ts